MKNYLLFYSGGVIPVGGMTLEEPAVPILLYDGFTEMLSKKDLKVTSVRLADIAEWEVERLNGGERALLDVNELYHESRVVDALRDLKVNFFLQFKCAFGDFLLNPFICV